MVEGYEKFRKIVDVVYGWSHTLKMFAQAHCNPIQGKTGNKKVCLFVYTTNKKEQMPPQRLITLTRGIQIRRQPIKKYKMFF